jgi:glyoxylase-like metal-dependent hydrolase (beta-lactamase superfamily II)
MLIKSISVGPLQVNCFIIADDVSKDAVVIDPGDEPDMIIDIIKKNGLTVQYIICTHGHFDHVGAVSDLKKETGAKVVLHKDELEIYSAALDMAAFWGYDIGRPPEPDMLLKDGDAVEFGRIRLEVLHTPGHSPGCICLYGNGILLTGDTIFAGSVGRTDLYGGDEKKLKESFKRLMLLPENIRALPGHGPETSIAREKHENMFSELLL